jgi:hypothetical protein
MKRLLMGSVWLIGQMVTLQNKPLVHLKPNENRIEASFGGKTLELIDAPVVILLPKHPPDRDELGDPWRVEVKNLGPRAVTIQGERAFSVQVGVGGTTQISSNGVAYSLKR